MRCAVIGLGEAGSRYATALVASGLRVRAFDPRDVKPPAHVELAGSEADAVTDADFVLVLTSAAAARQVAEKCAPHLKPGMCYADLTSSAPADMESLASYLHGADAQFADVAILGPVTVTGASTPLLISGTGAQTATQVLSRLGAHADVLNAPAGAAMAHKLLRSVFMKGLASLVVEAVSAGEEAGAAEWIRQEIASQLAGDGQAVIDRFLTGTRLHAERRGHEMTSARNYLASMNVASEMTTGTVASLRRLADENASGFTTGRSMADESVLTSSRREA